MLAGALRRQDARGGPGPRRRTRHPCAIAPQGWPLRRDVGAPAERARAGGSRRGVVTAMFGIVEAVALLAVSPLAPDRVTTEPPITAPEAGQALKDKVASPN